MSINQENVEYDEKVSVISEITDNPVAETAETVECPICFEVLNSKFNTITTPCGHSFCFNCLFKNIHSKKSASYNKCPCCREVLDKTLDEDEDEESSDYEDDDDEDDYEEDEEFEESDLYKYDVDEISRRFINKGYSLKDAIAIYLDSSFLKDYTEEQYEKIMFDLDEITEDLQDENYELFLMRKEDFAATTTTRATPVVAATAAAAAVEVPIDYCI